MRASRMLFSTAYLDETMAFIAPDGLRTEFATWDQLRQKAGLRLGIPNIPYYIEKVRDRLPQAESKVLPEFTTFFTEPGSGHRRAGLCRRTRLGLDADVPKVCGGGPRAGRRESAPRLRDWPAGPGPGDVRQHLDRTEAEGWYCSTRSTGTGFSGWTPRPRQPRWSIMRNVLGWTPLRSAIKRRLDC